MKINNIEVGKTYNYFDDGKITESRLASVIITEIIPFNEIDDETLELWEDEVGNIDWIYAKKTDYFIKGKLTIINDETEDVVFVRTIEDKGYDWFSLGWWGGILDYDGKYTKILNDRVNNNLNL
jgi:hypothetical protein